MKGYSVCHTVLIYPRLQRLLIHQTASAWVFKLPASSSIYSDKKKKRIVRIIRGDHSESLMES